MNSLLSNAFVGYLTARVALGIANTMLIVAIGWHLYELTGDPWSLALVGLMQIIPVYVFFFISGYAIDRFPRVWVVRVCAILEASAVIGIAHHMPKATSCRRLGVSSRRVVSFEGLARTRLQSGASVHQSYLSCARGTVVSFH